MRKIDWQEIFSSASGWGLSNSLIPQRAIDNRWERKFDKLWLDKDGTVCFAHAYQRFCPLETFLPQDFVLLHNSFSHLKTINERLYTKIQSANSNTEFFLIEANQIKLYLNSELSLKIDKMISKFSVDPQAWREGLVIREFDGVLSEYVTLDSWNIPQILEGLQRGGVLLQAHLYNKYTGKLLVDTDSKQIDDRTLRDKDWRWEGILIDAETFVSRGRNSLNSGLIRSNIAQVLRLAESFVPIRDVNYFDAREQTRWKNDQPFHLLLFLSDDDRNAITLAIRQLQVYNASNKLIVEFLSAIHQDSFTYRQLLILKPLLIPKLFEKIHDVIAERYRIGRRAWQWGVVIQMQDGTFKAFAGLRHSRRELICKLLEQGGMVVQAHLWQDTPEGRKEIIDTKIDRANDPKLSTIDFRTLFGGGHDLRVFGDRVNDVSRKRRGSSESNSAAKREEHPPHSVQP